MQYGLGLYPVRVLSIRDQLPIAQNLQKYFSYLLEAQLVTFFFQNLVGCCEWTILIVTQTMCDPRILTCKSMYVWHFIYITRRAALARPTHINIFNSIT